MREEDLPQVREREQLSEIIFVFLGFNFSIGAISISKEFMGFLLYGFPKEKYVCLLSPMIIVMHVILLDKIIDHIDYW